MSKAVPLENIPLKFASVVALNQASTVTLLEVATSSKLSVPVTSSLPVKFKALLPIRPPLVVKSPDIVCVLSLASKVAPVAIVKFVAEQFLVHVLNSPEAIIAVGMLVKPPVPN